jgi:putative ABC transport system permease protein
MLFLAYTMRNLIGRARFVIPVVLVIAAAVTGIMAVLAVRDGLIHAIESSGDPKNAIVLQRGMSNNLDLSHMPLSTIDQMRAAPGVARQGSVDAISPEYLDASQFESVDGVLQSAMIRGVDPVALAFHHVDVDGTFPTRGMRGVIVGRRLLAKFVGFQKGGTIPIGRHRWPVVGVFTAAGSSFESEIWCDRAALMSELNSDTVSVISVALDSPGAQEPFAVTINRNKPIEAMSEPAYYRARLSSVAVYFKMMQALIFVIALGAILAGTNAMHAAFLARTREAATLLAIGISRIQVAILFLQESLILSFCSAVLGILAATLIDGRAFGYSELGLVYSARVSLPVIVIGAAIGGCIGFAAGFVAVIQAMRMRILAGLASA